jgi:hypothetical protein
MFILLTLSMRVRNWCVHWACASETDACAEHTSQKLIRALSIWVRNWCVHWAYASGTKACTERSPSKTGWAYASGTNAYPEHTGQGFDAYLEHTHQFLTRMLSISVKLPNLKRSLQHMLSMCVRNRCVHRACASGTEALAQHAHQKLKNP